MRIGTSLRLEEMLRSFLVVLTQRLQASATQIWLRKPGSAPPVLLKYAFPSQSIDEWSGNDAISAALHACLVNLEEHPSTALLPDGGGVQVLAIGDLGCLFIEARQGSLLPTTLSALDALMPRLAFACQACFTHANNLDLLALTCSQNIELEEARARQQEQERAKSEFLAAISHDMRTPLNGIMGFAELLELELEGHDLVEYAQNIHAAGRHLYAMFTDLLDLAKLDSHRLVLHPEQIDIQLLVDELARPYQAQAEKKGIAFSTDLDVELPHFFITDPVRLRQILGNLLSNAIRYTHAGSIALEVWAIDRAICFAVSDTGVGIEESAQTRVFERFQQAAAPGKRQPEGTGLGLSIARDLAHLMGGHIELESVPGRGSCFRLLLPHVPPAARHEPHMH